MTTKTGPGLAMLGGATVVLGSFMPWVKVSSIFGTININGTDGDGVLTLIGGGLLVLFGFLVYNGTAAHAGTILTSLALLGLGIFETANISEKIDEAVAEADGYATASVGSGLYIILVGAVIGLAGAVIGNNQAASKSAEKPRQVLP